MTDETALQLLSLAALTSAFLIVLPASMNITHRLYGGGYVSLLSWLAIASFVGTFAGVLMYGKYLGHPYLAGIPAVILAYIVAKVCEWLEMGDGWTPEKPFDPLAAKRWTVGFAILAVMLLLLPEFLNLPILALFVIYTGAGICGMTAMNVAGLGVLKWRRDEERRRIARL